MFHTQAFWFCTLRLNPPVRVPLPALPLGGCRLGGCRLRSTAPRCAQVPFRRHASLWLPPFASSVGHFRHNDHRQGVTIADWVLVQGTVLDEDHAAAGRDLHTREPIVRCLVHAESLERLSLQPLLDLLHPLVWREVHGAMDVPTELGEVQLQPGNSRGQWKDERSGPVGASIKASAYPSWPRFSRCS